MVDAVLSVRLGGYVDVSTVDWQDRLTCMLFFSGCNFACPYCQNSRLIPADSGTETDLDSVEELLMKGRRLLDAVGFSGGEPTLQPGAVAELSSRAKLHGLESFLNTNGSQPTVLRRLLNRRLIDHLAVDVKAPLERGFYGRIVGQLGREEEIIKAVSESIRTALEHEVSLELRTTVVPGLVESKEHIEGIVSSLPVGSYRYVLQQFVPSSEVLDPPLREVKPPSRESLIALGQHALSLGLREVYVRTRDLGLEKVRAA